MTKFLSARFFTCFFFWHMAEKIAVRLKVCVHLIYLYLIRTSSVNAALNVGTLPSIENKNKGLSEMLELEPSPRPNCFHDGAVLSQGESLTNDEFVWRKHWTEEEFLFALLYEKGSVFVDFPPFVLASSM